MAFVIFPYCANRIGQQALENQPITDQLPGQLHLTKSQASGDKLVLAEFCFGSLAGVIAFLGSVLTTVVEVPGFLAILLVNDLYWQLLVRRRTNR